MSKYSRKFKRALALLLTFVMAVSVITVTPSTTVEAASKKVVKSLTGVAKTKTMNVGDTATISAKIKATKKVSKSLLQVTVKSSNASVVAAKVASKPKKNGKSGASKITLTAKSAGTAVITVTAKGRDKKNKKVARKMKVTVNDVTTQAPTTAAPTTEATTQAPTTQAPTTEVPTVEPKKVTKISSINDKTGEIVLTFEGKVTEAELKGSTLTVTAEDGTEIPAQFVEVSADGNTATYKVDLDKIQTGEYKITSNLDTVVIPAEIGSSSAKIQITGSAVKGLVYYKEGGVFAVPNAKITVGGKTVKTDKDGFYEIKANAQQDGQVSVKADGFFDIIKDSIDIVDNKASAYNFEMEPYDISKIYIYGTVTNAADKTKAIAGATVTLYEGNEVKAQVVTDATGRYAFKNDGADISGFAVGQGAVATFPLGEYITRDKDYTIKVEKNLSANNLTDVYTSKTTEIIDLGSAKNINVNIALAKVAKMDEISLKLDWEEDAAKKADSKKVSVTFMDTDGVTVLKQKDIDLTDYLNDTNNGMSKVYKLADNNYFETESSNDHPTLPAGTYYLVIKDLNAAGGQQNATEVIPVSLTEGGKASATTTIETAVSRSIHYGVTISDKYKSKSLDKQGEAGELKTVTDNKGTVGVVIEVATKVYQKVGNTEVLIDTLTNVTLSTNGKEGTQQYPVYGADKEKNNLAVNKEYVVETIKSNLVSAKASYSTDNEEGWNVGLKGAANVINVKVKDADRFVDEYTSDKTAEDERVLVNAVTVVSGDKATTIQVNKKYLLSDLCTTGISLKDADIDDSAFHGLVPGEYTVTLDIEGYQLSAKDTEQDEPEAVIDLEDASLISEAKYEKVYPTTVKGVIAYKTLADNAATLTSDGIAVLYTKDMKKIVAASHWKAVDGQITYSLEDGKDGTFGAGDYVLIIRGKGIDTQTKGVTIPAANTVVMNQNFEDLNVGGNSNIKSSVKTEKTTGLGSNASVVAYDAYYINPFDDAVDYYAFRTLYLYSKYDGAYTLSRVADTESEWGVENISAGTYYVEILSDTTVEERKKIAVEGTYSTPMIVQLKNFDNLIKIKLYLSNYNDTYENGQIDYIVASSTDGAVKNEGVFVRANKTDDFGYFYVPRDKAYTVYVYSNDSLVAAKDVTAQSSENETVRVQCEKIE